VASGSRRSSIRWESIRPKYKSKSAVRPILRGPKNLGKKSEDRDLDDRATRLMRDGRRHDVAGKMFRSEGGQRIMQRPRPTWRRSKGGAAQAASMKPFRRPIKAIAAGMVGPRRTRVGLCVSWSRWNLYRAGPRHRPGCNHPTAMRVITKVNWNLYRASPRHRCRRNHPVATRVIARPNRNLYRASPRHCCGCDHPVAAARTFARPKVVQEDGGLA
jgi:hypothetical protein